jgi:hypothetical protein
MTDAIAVNRACPIASLFFAGVNGTLLLPPSPKLIGATFRAPERKSRRILTSVDPRRRATRTDGAALDRGCYKRAAAPEQVAVSRLAGDLKLIDDLLTEKRK